jgi:hypothetical protein
MSVTFGTEATAPALAGRVGITRRFSQGVALGLEFGHLGRPDRGEEGLGFFQAAAAPTIVS